MLRSIWNIILRNIKTFTMIFALGFIWLLFSILTQFGFVQPENLSNLFRQMTIISFLSIGMVLVIVTGNIDLSVGSVTGFLSVIAAFLQYYVFSSLLSGMLPTADPLLVGAISTVLTIIVVVATGVGIGALQGTMVSYLGIPAFIVTLGGMFIFRGGVLAITQGKTIGPVEESMKAIAQEYTSPLVGWVIAGVAIALIFFGILWRRRQKKAYGFELKPMRFDILKACFFSVLVFSYVLVMNLYQVMGEFKSIQYPVLLMAVVALVFSYLSSNTRFGRYAYAIGGNKEAARLAGINIKKNILQVFILMGVLCAVAGIVLTGRVGYGTTSGGDKYELTAIAGCVIGGTSLMGGEGTILGALVGSLIMTSLDNGMSYMNLGPEWQYIIKGAVLILAVYLDVVSKKKK
ncbi:MAG: sugar ABC transporter permease [Spirochaetales bacterium]|nr:sugar ABC transporter permease [Spirochaetales bacterium]